MTSPLIREEEGDEKFKQPIPAQRRKIKQTRYHVRPTQRTRQSVKNPQKWRERKDNYSSDLPLLEHQRAKQADSKLNTQNSNLSNRRNNPLANPPTKIEATPFVIKKLEIETPSTATTTKQGRERITG
jgi:hypothetical protein